MQLSKRLLAYAPTPEIAAVVLADHPSIFDNYGPTYELPPAATEHLARFVRSKRSSAAIARHVAASTSDPQLLELLLDDKRRTVRAVAVLQCNRLGLHELAARCDPIPTRIPPKPVAFTEPPRSNTSDLPQVDLPSHPLRDDELFGFLRRRESTQIAAWLASDETLTNGFRPQVAARLLAYPKNQQRIRPALRALPFEQLDRIADWVDPWAGHFSAPMLQEWQARRLSRGLGTDAAAWAIAIGWLAV
jgi:hypothetical protein